MEVFDANNAIGLRTYTQMSVCTAQFFVQILKIAKIREFYEF